MADQVAQRAPHISRKLDAVNDGSNSSTRVRLTSELFSRYILSNLVIVEEFSTLLPLGCINSFSREPLGNRA